MTREHSNKDVDIDDMVDFGEIEDMSQDIIKVIGVGGGGCNAVRNMYAEGIEGVTYAICNTDSASLSKSKVPVKIQLGTAGLGAGANPEIGRREAQENIEDIERLIDSRTKMVFVTAGMGGGTGTGAAPVVAKVAKEKGALTIGVVTIPFYFEQKRKIIKALKGVEELRQYVDAMLIVNNERLCDIYSDTQITLKDAFKRADDVLKDAVKGISELITVSSEGDINLDFRDVETTLRNGGGAIMAIGRASGERRVERAIIDALDSPLLYGNDIGKAKRILFNIYASDEAPFFIPELSEISEFFEQLNPEIDVIWGTTTDNTLGQDAKVIILAADLEDELRGNAPQPHANDDSYYESLIPLLYKPTKPEKPQKPQHGKNAEEDEIYVEAGMTNAEAEKGMTNAEAEEGMTNAKAEEGMTYTEDDSHTDRSDIQSEDNSRKPMPMVERWKRWLQKRIDEIIEVEE